MSDRVAVLSAVSLMVLTAGAYSFLLLRRGSRWQRRCLLVVGQLGVLSLPWWVLAEHVAVRFFLSLVSVFLMFRMWETAEDASAQAKTPDSAWPYALFFTSIADLRFTTQPDERAAARRHGVLRLGRAVAKLAGLALLLWLNRTWPAWVEQPLLNPAWCLLAAYCTSTAFADLLTGITLLLTGHPAGEVFRTPVLASSPRDFWGRRWNLMFRNSAYRLVFIPFKGASRPLPATVAVFLLSVAVHEYIVVASLGTTGGHMTAFFLLHGAATIAQGWLKRRYEWRLSKPVSITLMWLWMLLTSPLFFTPILEILPLASLRW